MTRSDITLMAALGGLVVGILSLILQRREAAIITGDNTPFSIDTSSTGPTFNFGSRQGAGMASPSFSCGCGGSFGDPAVAKLNPIFGETIRRLPYGATPQVEAGLPVTFLGNGAAA